MTSYLVDTTTLIDFANGLEPLTSRLRAMIRRGERVILCAVTVAEFYAGLSMDEIARWEPLILSFDYRDVSLAAAKAAGRDRYRFARQGQAITTTDALIAAAAREQGAILITDNLRHFPMADIEILSLRG